MSNLENGMLKHIHYIVTNEYRPFSFMDLLRFEVDGLSYHPKKGTIRNKFVKVSPRRKDRIMLY